MKRLIDAENLEKTLEGAIALMETAAKAIGVEDDEGIQVELKAYKDILFGVKQEDTVLAIPVPWIEEKMKNLVSPGCKDVIDWLLAEWREEQKNVRKSD